MTERNKWIVLVTTLLRVTQQNEINWARRDPPDAIERAGERTDIVYEASFQGRHFRIYSYDYKDWSDAVNFEWTEDVKLEFIDEQRRSVFVVPTVQGIHDLLEAVKYQSADIDQFLQQIGA